MRQLSVGRARLLDYAIAVFAAGSAAGVRVVLTPFFADRNQLVMFYPAIMVSAWWGGLWPGIVATAVSAALDGYLFLEPAFTLRLTRYGDELALAIFVVTGVVISVLNENLRSVAAREQNARTEAERARADADAANRTKDFFMATVSHDLRAPMTAALGWVDMLSKHMLDESQRQHAVEAIHRALNRQVLLVSDLLDQAAIFSGKLRVEQKAVDIAGVVRAAVEIAEPLAVPKRLRLAVEYDSSGIVSGDAGRLQQVISNLLTNAIKFTPEGGDIQVRMRRDGRMAAVEVSDSGRGISKDALPLVFERFWQGAGTSSTRRDRGVGLGLSIAKHLVLAHGGSIEVSSAGDGKGATFTVRLPLVESPVREHDEAHRELSSPV